MPRDRETRPRLKWLIGREVAGTFLVMLLLVSVMAFVPVRLLQIPGYLVLAGFMLIRNAMVPGLSDSAYTVSVALYLYGLAILVGNLYRWS